MNELIKLGKITAPVGIKGELRVYPYIDDMTRFSDIKELVCDGKDFSIEKARYQKDLVILKFIGINDRNSAENLRNKELFIKRKNLWNLPENYYFIEDLLNMNVFDEKENLIGTLISVDKKPAQDLYLIKTTSNREFYLPAVKEFIKKIDVEKHFMVVKLIEGMVEL